MRNEIPILPPTGRESNQAEKVTAGPPWRYALVFALRTEARRRAADAGRRAAFRVCRRGPFFAAFLAAGRAGFPPPLRTDVRGPAALTLADLAAIRRTIVSSMLTLRARHASLNLRCTPSGTLRMRMLPCLANYHGSAGTSAVARGVPRRCLAIPARHRSRLLSRLPMLSIHAGYRSKNATSSTGLRVGLASSTARCFSDSSGDGSSARRPTMTSVTTAMPSGAPTAAAAALSE